MPDRFSLVGTLAVCALLTLSAPAAPDTSAATTLAERYSPVIARKPQPKPCGPVEAYRPTTVDIVLGNPEVVLRNSERRVVKRGPTALTTLADRRMRDAKSMRSSTSGNGTISRASMPRPASPVEIEHKG